MFQSCRFLNFKDFAFLEFGEFSRNSKLVSCLAILNGICKRLWSPGIDSEEFRGSPRIPPAYVGWRAGTTNWVVVPARQAGNRFLALKGSLIRALVLLSPLLLLVFLLLLLHVPITYSTAFLLLLAYLL
jgi:hypothetical protein